MKHDGENADTTEVIKPVEIFSQQETEITTSTSLLCESTMLI